MRPLHVGSLVFQYQALDIIGPTDLLNSSSRSLAKGLRAFIPISDSVISTAPDFVFHHVGLTLEPVHLLTSAITVVPTTAVEDCPDLDILLIGGPSPNGFELHPKYANSIRRHVAAGKLLFSTCTGASVVAATGVLDGKRATINNVEYSWVKQQYPKANWTREQKWVVDGNIWTGSGVVASMDMVAHWLKEKYGLEVLTNGALGLDYEARDTDGLFTVFPQRFDEKGKQISTHAFPEYEQDKP